MIHVPLNASRRLRAGLTSLALAAGWTTAAGQTAPAGQEASAGPEVIRLSPFTVDSSRDVGYRANNSISGTRLMHTAMFKPTLRSRGSLRAGR